MNYQLLTPRIPVNNDLTLVEQVFANRGIDPNDISHYLYTTEDDICDPKLLDNIHEGAEMLMRHFCKGDKIYVQIDSDADGYTSAAALINYLNFIAPGHTQQNISYNLHPGKEHGIDLSVIPEDVSLVVIPDAGSNDIEQQQYLYEQGIDVLILDHHIVDRPSTFACIINNQLGDYPNRTLSGVGVVYKLCQYIDSLLSLDYASHILDLVALGIISDMMELNNYETRELITLGCHFIENPFFQAFIEKQEYSLKGQVTPIGVAFYITPYINATVRMGTQQEKMLLFESMLNFRAYDQIQSTKRGAHKGVMETRVEQACRNCTNIKNRQTKARDTSLEVIKRNIEENNLLDLPVLLIQLENPVETNLTGLIANELASEYQRPVLLLNLYMAEDNTIFWRGSGRNTAYSPLESFKNFLSDFGLFEYVSGHDNAFGVSIADDFIEPLKEYIHICLDNFDFTTCYHVDFIWNSHNLENKKESIMEIGDLADVWGQGMPEPYVAIENIVVSANNITLMSPDKSPTLKITLPGNISLIKFRSSKEEYENLYSQTGCVTINIVGTCNINEWMGNRSPQIFIKDYEIISKSAYYF